MNRFLWIIALCFLVGGVWYYKSRDSGSDVNGQANASAEEGGSHGKHGRNAAIPVSVAAAAPKDIPVFLQGLGNITPRNTVTVHTQINGELMRVLFKEGQPVKKGDLLAVIDDRPYAAALQQAQGFLKRDEALLTEAKLDLARYTTLWKQDSIARQQLDTQTSLVKQYEGAVGNDQGQVKAAEVNLIYTKITSPVSGRVGLRQVDPGNIVHTTDTNGIVIVTELQPITAIFTLPEDNISGVYKHMDGGETLRAEAWDRDNKTLLAEGRLTAIDNQVDPATGTVKFRAEFANDDNALFPSQFVNIRLRLETLKDAVTIPSSGILRGTNGTFVYLVKPGNTVTVRQVTTGPAEGNTVSIVQGLSVGDEVVVDGTDSLKEGSKIDIAARDGKPADAASEGEGKKDGQNLPEKEKAQDPEARAHKHKQHPSGTP